MCGSAVIRTAAPPYADMEVLKHECGIALVRLLKPRAYYERKYGTKTWGLDKLYLLMEKQHNRGQEGAGIVCLNINGMPGEEYMFRERAEGSGAIPEIFAAAHAKPDFNGEIFMGHLRYSTTGKSGLQYVHPFLRRNNWRARNLAFCGNFNITNVDELFESLTAGGQHPRRFADTYIMLEQMGHRLDMEVQRVYDRCFAEGLRGMELTEAIEERMDIANVLRECSPSWDGGYAMCGLTGSGECFTLRDPNGIRPAFWFRNDEVLVIASERPVIQTAFNVSDKAVNELLPGQAVILSKSGSLRLVRINAPGEKKACSFERIYFSRGSDKDIYRERKRLGENLVPAVLKSIGGDIGHTVLSFIPNTAEVAFYGLLEGFEKYLNQLKTKKIEELGHMPDHEELERILSLRVRSEKVALKDIKLRTFITEGKSRDDLAAHVYDVTYGSISPGEDMLVVIDDSIVRGTTLRQSIISILDRLRPKKMVILSSSPQVRYPDYYGIDMSSLDQFIAFKAMMSLIGKRGLGHVLRETYVFARSQTGLRNPENPVKRLYGLFTDEEISREIALMLTPGDIHCEVEIIFQELSGLHEACPDNSGDWYFSGDFPTPGGMRRVNADFVRYMEESFGEKLTEL